MEPIIRVDVWGDKAVREVMSAMALSLPKAGRKAAVAGAHIIERSAKTETIRTSSGEIVGMTKKGKPKYAPMGEPIPDKLTSRTGALRSSIRVEERPQELAAVVGPSVVYGRIHEFGGKTKAHIIRPRVKKLLRFKVRGEWVSTAEVHHPGSNIPPRPYLQPAFKLHRAEIQNAMAKTLADAVAHSIRTKGRAMLRFLP